MPARVPGGKSGKRKAETAPSSLTSEEIPGRPKFVLFAIADHADETTGYCWLRASTIAQGIVTASSKQVFVFAGSRAWKAWEAHRGKSFPVTIYEGRRGWWFPTLFPPQPPAA